MLYTEQHPEAPQLRVLDAAGNKVGKIKSIDLATGRAVRYATDAAGKVITDPLPPRPGVVFSRAIRLETVYLYGHQLVHAVSGLIGTTPAAPAANFVATHNEQAGFAFGTI